MTFGSMLGLQTTTFGKITNGKIEFVLATPLNFNFSDIFDN